MKHEEIERIGEGGTYYPRPSGRGSIEAIVLTTRSITADQSIHVHQDVAPLKLPAVESNDDGASTIHVHQDVAPLKRMGGRYTKQKPLSYPRPSGRGSIEACQPQLSSLLLPHLSTSIRTWLH